MMLGRTARPLTFSRPKTASSRPPQLRGDRHVCGTVAVVAGRARPSCAAEAGAVDQDLGIVVGKEPDHGRDGLTLLGAHHVADLRKAGPDRQALVGGQHPSIPRSTDSTSLASSDSARLTLIRSVEGDGDHAAWTGGMVPLRRGDRRCARRRTPKGHGCESKGLRTTQHAQAAPTLRRPASLMRSMVRASRSAPLRAELCDSLVRSRAHLPMGGVDDALERRFYASLPLRC